ILDFVLDTHHGRKARIDGNNADLAFFLNVFIRGTVASAVLNCHLHHERHIVGQSRDDVLGVNDMNIRVGDDVGALDHALVVPLNTDGARRITVVFDNQALDVEDDVGHVLDDAGNGADLVLYALDFDTGDRAAFEAGQQHAAQAVADRDAETALERLDA